MLPAKIPEDPSDRLHKHVFAALVVLDVGVLSMHAEVLEQLADELTDFV